ncbi:MgtC/SapB family protein [Alkaliphilus pronyensis]|uniref:MgtC/SapB family protein n=1 Tax=Alkaliphilus pronyensis TaxID=1482732 RepID=A0A6I0F562_9FIRM|nr:MgtC/SapB family protein [Alkaliphilus pronyensis]KAB3537710.1 MgtC/SapB family protein [Alkaliphilus pronyensis]
MLYYSDIIIRLLVATLLGGVIGIERESVKRAAGFRTHILVCTGAALVMLLSIFIFENYKSFTSTDPARLGAQVISGIGFLGAGTIIKDGNTIKGLTTAASLWSVASIGLALGAGFYSGAVITAIIVLIALKIFSKLEIYIPDRRSIIAIKLNIDNVPGQLGRVAEALGNENISIIHVSLEMNSEESKIAQLYLRVKTSAGHKNQQQNKDLLMRVLSNVEGVRRISVI